MELLLSSNGRRYGYLKGSSSYPLVHLTIPLAQRIIHPVDLTPWQGPVKDQGQLGCCTAATGTEDLEYLFRKYKNQDPVFSMLDLYYKERVKDGTVSQGDAGSTGNTSCWTINHQGICLESSRPFDITTYQTPPTQEQITEAENYRSGAYHAVMNVADIRSCIASGYCVRVGFTVYESFESQQTANSGIMPLPDKTKEQVLGGHEVLFVGFDDSQQAFKVRNSWGTSWGVNGDFYFPYAAVNDPDIFMDGRMQHFGNPWKP